MHTYAIVFITLFSIVPAYINADCIGCMTPYVENLPNGEIIETYVKKCQAKQKHIDGDFCDYCSCPKSSHSVHKHPYKIYKNKKVSELPIETLLPPEENEEEQTKAIKELVENISRLNLQRSTLDH